jgi:hypothetical protein
VCCARFFESPHRRDVAGVNRFTSFACMFLLFVLDSLSAAVRTIDFFGGSARLSLG